MSTQTAWDDSEHPHQDFLLWAQCIEEPLALLDEDGVLVAFNDRLGELFGLEPDSDDEEPELFDLILAEDGQRLLAHWDGSIIDPHQPARFLARHVSTQDSPRTMLWKIKPSPRDGLWLLAVRDVELEQSRLTMPTVSTTPDLSAALSRACMANLLQTREFLSSLPRIIHDLKAPNRRVRMFAQLLNRELDTQENSEARSYSYSIVENASRNEALVEEIKGYFSLHKLIQKPTSITIAQLIEDAAHKAVMPMEQIHVEGPGEFEVKLPLKLSIQALAELIENASLHGKAPGGQEGTALSIVIDVLSPELGARSPWTLRVSDQGPGFQDGIDEILFEPLRTGLSMAKEAQSASTPRFGMGLATAHRCMLFLGGELELSKTPKGASFLLSFPSYS